MATHHLNKTTHKTWNIDTSGDSWVLGENGRITGIGFPGVLAADSITDATIRINGDILLGGLNSGMNIGAQHAEITIGKTGHVSSGGHAIHYDNIRFDNNLEEHGTVSIYNRGLLEGSSGIVAITAVEGGVIRNGGRIDATNDGIFSAGSHNTIVNTGVIKAGQDGIWVVPNEPGADALLQDNAVRIINDGTIKASGYSISANGVAVNILNRGLLRGDVVMGDGDDVFDSSQGTVKGGIYAGGGNDAIYLDDAIFTGVIQSGAGDDYISLNSADTIIIEFEGEGTDTVFINDSYTLGANIEDLALGTGNHTGIGNTLDNSIQALDGDNTLFGLEGNDQLDGGNGHDTLWGGAGDDEFVFGDGYGSDLIMDFEQGADKIDLANVAGVTSFGDLAMAYVGADLVITFSDTDELVLKDATVDEIVLTADDFIF